MKNFLLVLILLLFVNTGYCAEIKRYVCTASTAGGDGTTSATTGANRAYASLKECMNANEQDLTDNGGDTFVVEITGDCSTADTTVVTIHNYTTSATCYINIYTTSTARHKGKWSDSYYRLVRQSWYQDSNCFTIANNYVRIDGLQLKRIVTTGNYGNLGAIFNFGYAGYATIKNCIGYIDDQYSNNYNFITGLANVCYLYNNICIDYRGGHVAHENMTGLTLYAYNNTYINVGRAHNNSYYGQGVYKNEICQSSSGGACYNGGEKTTCLTNDTTGSTGLTGITLTYKDSANLDYHLSVSDTSAMNVGTDLTSDATIPISDDIDGETRPTGANTWDVGADEYVNPIQLNLILNNSIFNNVQLN